MLSGDSTVRSYSFNGEIVELTYEDYDSDETYFITIQTPQVFTQATGGERIVHMRIESVLDKLAVEDNSGRYMLPDSFSKQMSVFNQGYHIFGGLKASEYPKAFILSKGPKILLCPIRSEEDIKIEKV